MASIGNPLTLDPSLNTVTSPTSWLEEGFRVNDWCLVRRYSSSGTVLGEWWSQISFVDDITADFSNMPEWYSIPNGEFMVFEVVQSNGSYSIQSRQDIDLFLNHIKNSLTFGEFSLIDGEASRIIFQGLETMLIGQTINGVFVGNQSGQFIESASITRLGNFEGWFLHSLSIDFINSGGYNSDWFQSSECLKLFIKLLWARFTGEPISPTQTIYNLNANTGFFNEANNSSINDATLIQGIGEIDYCLPTSHTIIVDGPISQIGIGGMYISTNDNYYKNKPESQTSLTMLLKTTPDYLFGLPVDSELNPSGAGYTIALDNINSVGSITTIDITFTPNPAFSSFFDTVENGDRLFYLWIKCGNLNLTAFQGQLTCEPPVGGILPMFADYGYLNHAENITIENDIKTDFEADTEDDLAYYGTFLLDKNQIYDSFSVKLEAFNTVSEDDFTLQIATFSFAGIPISNDGRYLLNESQTIVTTLPNTSVKIEAVLTLVPSLDTPTQYGVSIYYPFLCRWEYWLNLNGVNVDFYPDYNKNWEQYDNIGDWQIRTELLLIKEGLSYIHNNPLVIRPYDAEILIDSSIQMFIESSNTLVDFIPENELMRIRSTHVNLLEDWPTTFPNIWGLITVESYESSPRWICSSVIDYDYNTSNPLTPVSGLTINILFPSPNTAVLECLFDSSLIDLSNGVKVTAKIQGGKGDETATAKTTAPLDELKTTSEDNDVKTLAP
jgi:hypothetical protein